MKHALQASDWDKAVSIENTSGQLGLADSAGQLLLPCRYAELGNLRHGLAVACLGWDSAAPYGYLDPSGAWQITPRFAQAGDFAACGLAAVRLPDAGCFAYADAQGELRLTAGYETAGEFDVHRRARVTLGGREVMIDTQGQVVLQGDWQRLGAFAPCGLARVVLDEGSVGYIDRSGALQFKSRFDAAFGFDDAGFATVLQDDAYGLIDRRGELVLPARFESLGSLRHGLICAGDNSRVGFIGLDGQWRIAPQLADASAFMPCGLALFMSDDGLWGALDTQGQVVIAPEFDDLQYGQHPSLIEASRDGREGYIDLSGRWCFDRQWPLEVTL